MDGAKYCADINQKASSFPKNFVLVFITCVTIIILLHIFCHELFSVVLELAALHQNFPIIPCDLFTP